MVNVLGFELNIDWQLLLLLMVFLGAGTVVMGIFYFIYFNNLHPKTKIMCRLQSGGWRAFDFRIFYGIIPTELDITALLLGKIPTGFPIEDFPVDWLNGQKMRIAYYMDGRLVPFGLETGTSTLTEFRCNKCGYSDLDTDKYIIKDGHFMCPKNYPLEISQIEFPKARDLSKYSIKPINFFDLPKELQDQIRASEACDGEMVKEPITVTNTYLHKLKFTPDIEKRAMFFVKSSGSSFEEIPWKERIIMLDLADGIARRKVNATKNAEKFMAQANPLMNAIIISLPFTLPMLIYALSSYLAYSSTQQANTELGRLVLEASKNILLAKGIPLNSTG
jgi:hypothetical protein